VPAMLRRARAHRVVAQRASQQAASSRTTARRHGPLGGRELNSCSLRPTAAKRRTAPAVAERAIAAASEPGGPWLLPTGVQSGLRTPWCRAWLVEVALGDVTFRPPHGWRVFTHANGALCLDPGALHTLLATFHPWKHVLSWLKRFSDRASPAPPGLTFHIGERAVGPGHTRARKKNCSPIRRCAVVLTKSAKSQKNPILIPLIFFSGETIFSHTQPTHGHTHTSFAILPFGGTWGPHPLAPHHPGLVDNGAPSRPFGAAGLLVFSSFVSSGSTRLPLNRQRPPRRCRCDAPDRLTPHIDSHPCVTACARRTALGTASALWAPVYVPPATAGPIVRHLAARRTAHDRAIASRACARATPGSPATTVRRPHVQTAARGTAIASTSRARVTPVGRASAARRAAVLPIAVVTAIATMACASAPRDTTETTAL
jgi:hypothetical protein